jgi:DNA helicase HerA-like ATPase
MSIDLFPRNQIVGHFRGFREGGLEFHADLVLPYRNEFQSIPMHGQFLLVQLESPDEAVLGRITSLSSEGKLSTGAGEEFTIRAIRENRPVPEDLRADYLRYSVNIRVLGVLRTNGERKLTFVASHRRLPHVGSPVAFASDEVLREIAGHNDEGAVIGHLAFGEYVYAQGSKTFKEEEWMQVKGPEVQVKFAVESLVSRRSFVLARAGFGKSNLNKLLFSMLYHHTPTVTKRMDRQVPVGTVIFDRDGEYFWPDDKGRPGLCDVPALQDQLVVFTSRAAPSAFYGSFVAGGIRLDIRLLKASDVITIALPPERQDQQNVRKLAALDSTRWQRLVDLVHRTRYQTPVEEIATILEIDPQKQEAEALAAKSNMVTVVHLLHDPTSQLMDKLFEALAAGKLCVVDVSQMRGLQALTLSGLILRQIFDRNQEQFTAAEPKTIPTIAVVEEAQSVLNEHAAASEPYIAWVKEGRKYDLGALLITQQPGSIPTDILSQGDNWFIFHLLSAIDLTNVRRANAHFSDDLLSTLLNEPIPGQGVFWSSVAGKSYPLSVRVLSFEQMYRMLDPDGRRGAVDTYASQLQTRYLEAMEDTLMELAALSKSTGDDSSLFDDDEGDGSSSADGRSLNSLDVIRRKAVLTIRADPTTMQKLHTMDGMLWGSLKGKILEAIPDTFQNRDKIAYDLVVQVLTTLFGRQGEGWHSFKNSSNKTAVRIGKG